MRTWVLAVLFGLFLTACTDKAKLQEQLWGEWIGQGGVTMQFSASGLIHMQVPDGPARDGTYVADFDQNPYWLDIDLRDKRIATIFRFDTEGRLVVQSTEPNKARPTEFTNGAVYFTRKVSEASPKGDS